MFKDFMIALMGESVFVFETIEGNLMSQMSIGMILLGADDGSSVTLFPHEGHRYSFVFDECSAPTEKLLLFDKERLSLFRIRLPMLLEQGFLGAVKESLELVSEDADSIHENVIKTANFRLKKLSSL